MVADAADEAAALNRIPIIVLGFITLSFSNNAKITWDDFHHRDTETTELILL